MRAAILSVLAVSLLAAGCSDSSSQTSPSTVTHAVVESASAATKSSAPGDTETGYRWYTTDPVASDVRAVMSANNKVVSAVRAAIGTGDPSELPYVCKALKDTLVTFKHDFPSPDSKVNYYFSKSFAYYLRGTDNCIAGDFTTVGDDLVAGNKWTIRATDRISSQKP